MLLYGTFRLADAFVVGIIHSNDNFLFLIFLCGKCFVNSLEVLMINLFLEFLCCVVGHLKHRWQILISVVPLFSK